MMAINELLILVAGVKSVKKKHSTGKYYMLVTRKPKSKLTYNMKEITKVFKEFKLKYITQVWNLRMKKNKKEKHECNSNPRRNQKLNKINQRNMIECSLGMWYYCASSITQAG